MLVRLNQEQARAGRRTAFLGAVMDGKLEAVQKAIFLVVEDSFNSHPMRHRTGAEETRRVQIVMGWLQKLTKDHHYTLDKAIHTIRRALLCELDGGTFTPPLYDARTVYAMDEALVPYSEAIHDASRKALS